jgi:transcriptional regulator with XRE-family HTH domain
MQAVKVVNQHVGQRMRERRIQLSLTQSQIARSIGITHQQLYKYENGLNRVSVGRLLTIATVLDVSISWMFEGLPEHTQIVQLTEKQETVLQLVQNFGMIEDGRQQEAFTRLVRALVQADVSGSNVLAFRPCG